MRYSERESIYSTTVNSIGRCDNFVHVDNNAIEKSVEIGKKQEKGRNKMILIHEPDITLTLSLGTVLAENGFRGDIYNEILEIQNIKSPVYDVYLITDVVMSRMDGFEFIKQIKKTDGRNNIVFGTASGVNYA